MRSGKPWCFVILTASVLSTGTALADGFGCASSSPAGMVACLQTREAILTRELAVARQEKALRKMGDTDSRHLSLPQVESTYGSPGHLKSVLHWSGGASLVVSRGDVVPGGYRVVDIAPGRVSIAGRDEKRHVLLMEGGESGGGAASRTMGAFPSNGLAMAASAPKGPPSAPPVPGARP